MERQASGVGRRARWLSCGPGAAHWTRNRFGDRRAQAPPRGASAMVVAVGALIRDGDSFPDNVAPANTVALSQPLDRCHGVGAFAGVVAAQQAQEFYEPVSQLHLGKLGRSCRLGCRLFRWSGCASCQ